VGLLYSSNHAANKASSDTGALPIKRIKIMEKEIDIFGNLLMTINSVLDGK
jgi:hypothetical protein